MKLTSLGSFAALTFLVLLISSCSGGGGRSNTGNPALDTFLNNFIPHFALFLDNATGSLPAGSIVPISCITGGRPAFPDSCLSLHMHDTIGINGIGSGFTDPNGPVCGHGVLGIALEGDLSHRCPELDNAQLSIILNQLAMHPEIFLRLIEPNGTSFVIDLIPILFVGLNPIQETLGNTYSSAEIFTKCDRGMNPATGHNEIEHKKTIVDLTDGVQMRFQLADCKPFNRFVMRDLDIFLGNSLITGGDFYTGRKNTPVMPLTAGITNPLSFDVLDSVTSKSGLVVGFTSTTWQTYAFTYNPQASESIVADSSTLVQVGGSVILDSNYLGDSEYTGIKAFAKADGLFQSYSSLDGFTVSNRYVPTIPNLGDIGGIHKVRAEFAATETMTLRTQGIKIDMHYIQPPLSTDFGMIAKPPYFSDNDFSTTDDVGGLGFGLGLSYSPGSNFSVYAAYRLDANAETFDSGTTTWHKWSVSNYKSDMSMTDATWPSAYISSNGFAAMGINLTRIQYRMSDNAVATSMHSLYRGRPLEELDDTVSINLDYKF